MSVASPIRSPNLRPAVTTRRLVPLPQFVPADSLEVEKIPGTWVLRNSRLTGLME